jgi:peptidyl-dipeptidase A
MRFRPFAISLAAAAIGALPALAQGSAFQREVDAWLAGYQQTYQHLYTESSLAQWASNTHIVPGDTMNAARTKAALEQMSRFVGSTENIGKIRAYLARRRELTFLEARQLDAMLYLAADAPQTVPAIVKARIALETSQVEKLYGFQFTLSGAAVTPNDIDDSLAHSTNLADRRAVWEASKEVGKSLRPGVLALRDLRNQTVQSLGYPDYFAYRVSEYGMTTDEMVALNDTLIAQLRPLYRELHTWARYELAKRYNAPVPDYIPADWLPNRWGQDWAEFVDVAGLNSDSAIALHTPEWVVKQGQNFYVSLGFDTLPSSFWTLSSFYPVPPDAGYKKNTHATAWHIDLEHDVRSLMSVTPNTWWYQTVHHELGHINYYMSYSRPAIPLVLRGGANRAYHEGIGSMIGLAATQRRFLVDRGLLSPNTKVDTMRALLKEALNYVVFIPWSSGTMTHFERDLYSRKLPADSLNARWWEYVKQFQGVVPPSPRGELWADAATKTHITDDPASYYDYALSYALLMQLHTYIATKILHQDPHDTDYFGSVATGDFLRSIMKTGAAVPWRDVLRETTGKPLDAQAMVEYFAPLYTWLKEQNKGRVATIP